MNVYLFSLFCSHIYLFFLLHLVSFQYIYIIVTMVFVRTLRIDSFMFFCENASVHITYCLASN